MDECGSTIPNWFPWPLTGRGKMRYVPAGHARVPSFERRRMRSRKFTWEVLLVVQLVLSGCEQEQSVAANSERTIETASPNDVMGSGRTNDPGFRCGIRDDPRASAAGVKPTPAQGKDQAGYASLDRTRRQLDQHVLRLESLVRGLFLMVHSRIRRSMRALRSIKYGALITDWYFGSRHRQRVRRQMICRRWSHLMNQHSSLSWICAGWRRRPCCSPSPGESFIRRVRSSG